MIYPTSTRERLERLVSALWTTRTSGFDPHYREISDFLQPRRSRWVTSDRNKGDKRNQNIIDSTGRFAWRTLQSGLHAGLTSPSRPWFRLTTPDPDLADFGPVKEYLHIVTQRMQTVFLRSNLYNGLPMAYGDFGGFGTAAMGLLEDTKDLFRTYVYPVGSYALGVDERGLVTTFTRKWETTVRQVVKNYGAGDNGDIDWSRISPIVKNAWDRGDYEDPVTLTLLILPNEEARTDRLEAKYLPWASYTWEDTSGQAQSEKRFLRESGFRSFPILAPRWEVASPEDSYGTDCPGMTVLGDVKQLQHMQRKKALAINKMVDPPLVGPPALRTQKTSLLAGDITYVDERDGQKGLRSIHDVQLRLDHLLLDVQEVRFLIRRGFYEDLFLMLAQRDEAVESGQPVTAREIDERHEEKLLALGPVLERTNDELLDPLIDRSFQLMEANGLLPEAPPELQGVALKVEYVSILAQAQKLVGVVAQDRLLSTIVPLMEAFPQIRHKIDIFRAVDNYNDLLGADPRLIVPTEQAQAAADAEAEQQQAMADAQQAKDVGAAMSSAARAPMDSDNALTRLVRGVA